MLAAGKALARHSELWGYIAKIIFQATYLLVVFKYWWEYILGLNEQK